MSSTEDLMKAVLQAQDDYASYGITTMQEGMVVPLLADLLAYMAHAKMMKIDYIAYVDIREREKIFEKLHNVLNIHVVVEIIHGWHICNMCFCSITNTDSIKCYFPFRRFDQTDNHFHKC